MPRRGQVKNTLERMWSLIDQTGPCCVHQGPIDGPGCMVWLVHNLHNYEQHSNAGVQSVLTTLIPRDADGTNLQCLMFLEK